MDSAAAAGGVRRGDPPKCWGTQREGEFGALDWRPRRARVRTRRPLALGDLGIGMEFERGRRRLDIGEREPTSGD